MALVDNKEKIQALLAGINALPEAGSGEPAEPVLQEKSVTPTKAAQSVTPDTGYDGLSKVNVGAIPDEYIAPSGTVSITENGTHNVREAESVSVNVSAPVTEPVLQEKTVSPATSSQTVRPDNGYDGLSQVTVSAMPTATQATPSISVNSSGLITASATQSAGYVAAGTKSATKQLTTQGAQTITPGTSDKTIASGRYLTGTQTIKGDVNLKATNIVKGISIFGVTGTHEGGEDVSTETAEYTAQLDELEEVIDSLPEAGSGGSSAVETCTVTCEFESVFFDHCFYHDGSTFQIHDNEGNFSVTSNKTFTVAKGTCFILYAYGSGWGETLDITGDLEHLTSESSRFRVFIVNGDGTVRIENA